MNEKNQAIIDYANKQVFASNVNRLVIRYTNFLLNTMYKSLNIDWNTKKTFNKKLFMNGFFNDNGSIALGFETAIKRLPPDIMDFRIASENLFVTGLENVIYTFLAKPDVMNFLNMNAVSHVNFMQTSFVDPLIKILKEHEQEFLNAYSKYWKKYPVKSITAKQRNLLMANGFTKEETSQLNKFSASRAIDIVLDIEDMDIGTEKKEPQGYEGDER